MNEKPASLVTGGAILVMAILGWSLTVVYNNIIEKIDTKYTTLHDKTKENREMIKVHWELISINKDEIHDLEKELIREHAGD